MSFCSKRIVQARKKSLFNVKDHKHYFLRKKEIPFLRNSCFYFLLLPADVFLVVGKIEANISFPWFDKWNGNPIQSGIERDIDGFVSSTF